MTFEERVEQHIAAAAPALEKIPGVVIIHRIHPFAVLHMSESGLKRLNTSMSLLREMGPEYHQRFFNAEDSADYAPKVLGLVERNNDSETISHFQQVRGNEDEEWQWHLSGTRVFMHDDEGKPYLTISVAIPVDTKHYFTDKIERLLEENIFLRNNTHIYASLSKRETQILAAMAVDKTSAEIAKELFLSEETIKTHRKNIRKKLQAQNQYEIIKFAQAFNLI